MPTKTEQLNILLDVDDDVRAELGIGWEPFPCSIPHFDEPEIHKIWASEAYDRRQARMWGF